MASTSSKSIRTRIVAIIAAAIAIAAILATISIARHQQTQAQTTTATNVVKIGTDSDSYDDLWDAANQELAATGSNVRVQLVKMDGGIIGKALQQGEIDLALAGHYAFFNYLVQKGHYDFQPFAETFIQPLNVYSDKVKNVDQLKDGDKIAIPSDVTNQGRALKVFESAGLITVDPSKGNFAAVADITSNPHHLEFVGVSAYQVPQQLPDVAAGVIPAEIALDAGLHPSKDAIYAVPVHTDDVYNKPWINVIAGRSGEGDDPRYQAAIKAYGSERVSQVIAKNHPDDIIPTFKDLEV